MNILVVCKMGPGTLEAKLRPLTKVEAIKKIYVFRPGNYYKAFDKVSYINTSSMFFSFTFIRMIVTPIYMIYLIKINNIGLIISYHVIPYGIFAYLAGIITKVPYNISLTGTLIHKYINDKTLFGKFLIEILEKALFINVPGVNARNHLIKNRVDEKKICILHSSIDTDKFIRREEIVRDYDLIYVGSLEKHKKVELLIQAAKKVSNQMTIRVLIVGKGICELLIKTQIKELQFDNNIDLLGYRSDVSKLYNRAKIFVLCSEMEALSVSVMESMSCGVPVIAPNIGDLSMAVQNGQNGILLNDISVDSYSTAIKDLLINKKKCKLFSRNAREFIIKNHSDQLSTRKWNSVFTKFLA